jgi:hypothetical protein
MYECPPSVCTPRVSRFHLLEEDADLRSDDLTVPPILSGPFPLSVNITKPNLKRRRQTVQLLGFEKVR